MIIELIVTSASRGLQAGRSGFTTVLRTRGIHPDLASRLEAASAYRHVFPQGDSRNPVIFSYTTKTSSVGEVWVMSRVGDAGTDYSGRSNKIAHHIALQQSDIQTLGDSNPAAVMAALVANRGLLSKWEGEPRESPTPPQLPAPPTHPAACQKWASVAGDAGWAGVLVERALNKETTWVIASSGVDLLGLFCEALALVTPSQRWRIPFTTYSLRGDEGRWLGTVAGSPEATAAAAQKRIAVIDLTRRSTAPAGGPYVAAARGQANVPWYRPTTSIPARPGAGDPTPQRAAATPPTHASAEEQRTQPGLPPVLARNERTAFGRPPDLTEWEEVDLAKPRAGRLMLLVTLGSLVLVLGLLLLAYGAYRFRLLPTGWRESIDIAAWRYQLPLLEHAPPKEVDEARKVCDGLRAKIEDLDNALKDKSLEDKDLAAHPRLLSLLTQARFLHDGLSSLLKDENTVRTHGVEDITKQVPDANTVLAMLDRLTPKNGVDLLDAHLRVAEKLKVVQSNKYLNEKAKAARSSLETAAGQIETSEIALLDKLVAELSSALSQKPRTEGESSEKQPEKTENKPDIADLLRRAVEGQNNRPLQGLNDLKNAPPYKLISWEEEADPQSLAVICLELPVIASPDGTSCVLDAAEDTENQAERIWKCRLKDDNTQVVGSFALTPKELRFTPDKEQLLRNSMLPFLPIVIALEKPSPAGAKATQWTWLQLFTPGEPKKCCIFQRDTSLPMALCETARSEPTVLKHVVPHLRWSDVSISLQPSDGPIEISEGPSREFSSHLSPSLGTNDLNLDLRWRPNALATFGDAPSGFQDALKVACPIQPHESQLTLAGEVTFKYADSVTKAASHSKSLLPALLKRHARSTTAKWNTRDWRNFCWDIVLYGGPFLSKEWNDLELKDNLERFLKAYPDQQRQEINSKDPQKRLLDISQPFDDWVASLRHICMNREGFLAFVDALVTKQTGIAPSQNPGEEPQPKNEEEKKGSAFQARLGKWVEDSKAWKQRKAAIEELKASTETLAKWTDQELAKDVFPTDDMILAAAWQGAYRYQVASAHRAKNSGANKEIEAVIPALDTKVLLDKASVCVSGNVVLRWDKAAFSHIPQVGDVLPTIVVAELRPCPHSDSAQGNERSSSPGGAGVTPTETEGSKE